MREKELSRRKKPVGREDGHSVLSREEIQSALIAQEIADRARAESEALNSRLASRLSRGAKLDYPDLEFDWSKQCLRHRTKAS
jgi:hypothetical protein